MSAADLALLIDAALMAGDIAHRHWKGDPETWIKPDDSPVSEADIAVDTALRDALTHARPGYGWLSEETPDTPDRLGARHCFVVDPIDGTRSFLERQATWALSLAVVEDGRPTAAVVHLPARGLTYTAGIGLGATLNGEPIAVSRHATLGGATALATRATFSGAHWRAGPPPVRRVYRSSMAYRLCKMAQGGADAMLTVMPAWEWDIAAGVLIASEAGAAVTDRLGDELRFNSAGRRTEGVVAANAALHARLLDALA
ncbi:3'(2'),5'-bisphosphate nucleotidase CysQ [Palleronia sediminis]|uniref:3'(2'),5'-bisphosphate nucleotidase CysQ n=1 Tax=Palleronia sediminis TaxID=2547833 RepID=A0A4R6A671_9RHOB|nr:3'(2'),5'-bisphosphate nucleotidase CysQ [Palleronia sediminis]TDL78214.1 3'(2'),5'-bisphosphate nucleotidase CysQ [Palleronia sediminis]